MIQRIARADLQNYPHFHSPANKRWGMPTLRNIVTETTANPLNLSLVAISACHTGTSGMDDRFAYYSSNDQTSQIPECSIDTTTPGLIKVNSRGQKLLLIHTQKVRGYVGEDTADLNIIGAPELIKPTRSVEEIANEARRYDAIVNVCQPGTRCGMPLSKAISLYKEGLVDGVELSASVDKKTNAALHDQLREAGIMPLAVTGGHSHRLAGTSYTDFHPELLEEFSFEKLKRYIQTGQFTPHFGQIPLLTRIWTRDRHILASKPGHYLAGGIRREESRKATRRKK